MEIQNASTTSSKSNQLRNVNTVGWESWNVTTQPWEIKNRKSEVIAFVVNAGMNIHLNQITLSLISLISYLKLLIRQFQDPRSVLNQENLGLMMNVDRQ